MSDDQKWKIALARFNGYYTNVPAFVKTDDVKDYHDIVALLEEASGEDLSLFKIPTDKLKPKVVSFQPGGYGGGPGRVQYSKDNYCDSKFFQGQVDALKHYLSGMKAPRRAKTKYDDLTDYELQDLMINRGIKPKDEGRSPRMPNREFIIAALVKQDAPQPAHSTTYNVIDSNFIQSSPGASISVHQADFKSEEFRNLIEGIKQLALTQQLSQEAHEQIKTDIASVELQINAPQPKEGIIRESMLSVKAVLENAGGALVGAGIIAAIKHYFHIP